MLLGVALLGTGCTPMSNLGQARPGSASEPVSPPRSFSDTELDTAAEDITTFIAAGRDQIQLLWATANPDDFTVLLTNGTRTVFAEAGSWQAITSPDLPTQQAISTVRDTVGGSTAVQYAGRQTLLVHPGKPGARATATDILEAYETAMREAFHRYVQRLDGRVRWAGITDSKADATPQYPALVEPRQLRRALHSELYAALTDPNEEATHLERAKYWYDRWAAKYPDEQEALRSLDILEGTAEYFAVALTTHATAHTTPGKRLRTPDDLARSPVADVESSQIGAAALLLAKARGVERFDRVETGELTPVEAALEGVDAASSAPPPGPMESTLRAAVKTLNQDTGETFDPVLKRHHDGNATYLAFPSNYFSTGIEFRDTYVLTTIDLHASKQLSARSPGAVLRGALALETPSTLLLPVNPGDLSLAGDTLTIDTKHLTVTDLPFRKHTDRAGNLVYEITP